MLQVKPECPLCKQSFKSIIHNVRSNEDYDQYHLHPASENPYPWLNMINMDMAQQRFRYRYQCYPLSDTWSMREATFRAQTRGEILSNILSTWEIPVNTLNAQGKCFVHTGGKDFLRTHEGKNVLSTHERNIFQHTWWKQFCVKILRKETTLGHRFVYDERWIFQK